MQKNYFLLILILLCVACSEEENISVPPNAIDGVSFRLRTTGYAGSATRSTETLVQFDRLEHYIVNEAGDFTANIRSLYHTDLAQIKIEGIKDGNYHLLVLAVKGDYNADGAVIHKLNDSSSPWLSFRTTGEGRTLQAEYYYCRHSFTVSGGVVENPEIDLQRIVGKVEFRFNYRSDYVRKSIVSMNVIPAADSTFGNVLNADGTVSGAQSSGEFSLMDANQFLLLPAGEENRFRGNIVLTSIRHTGEEIEQDYQFDVAVMPNRHSVININIIHPDDNTGSLYIKNDDYTPDNFYTILSDSEPKSIYYNSSERSFYINAPLQLAIKNDTSLHLRFYSPVAISGVKVYAKTPQMRESFELAYFTQIPAFADAVFKLPLSKESVYQTESGQYISIPAMDRADIGTLQLKIVSDDPYWQKIAQIEARWYITFNAYGADPDDPQGGPAGNWMGMRPVHIREAVALLTNIAYMCTLEDFREKVLSYQGQIVGNDGKTPVDMSTVVNRLQNHGRFNTGLIYPGHGVIGLGGGATWGVYQNSYFLHYSGEYVCSTIFHELGHCMGYTHSSGMTYGAWSNSCCNKFYVNNIARFPVNSPDILNSNANPNKY